MDDHDQLIDRLRAIGAEPVDPALQASHLAAMADATTRRPASLWPKLRVAAALLVGFLVGTTGLATANALPDPAQQIAHSVLGQVGIDVPQPDRYHGPECGAEAKRNHGAYVRDDKTLAQSDCGKKVRDESSVGAEKDGSEVDDANEPKAATGACAGKPPWAGESMTAAEKAAAKAERTALCGEDPDDEADDVEAEEPDDEADELQDEKKAAADESTTTTAAPETTTTAAPESTTTTTG
jgi:hypothetical protein